MATAATLRSTFVVCLIDCMFGLIVSQQIVYRYPWFDFGNGESLHSRKNSRNLNSPFKFLVLLLVKSFFYLVHELSRMNHSNIDGTRFMGGGGSAQVRWENQNIRHREMLTSIAAAAAACNRSNQSGIIFEFVFGNGRLSLIVVDNHNEMNGSVMLYGIYGERRTSRPVVRPINRRLSSDNRA